MLSRRVVLVATSLAAFTATLDNTVVAVALRDVQRDLGAGVTGLQGVVTGYTVALAALLLVGGAFVDRLGPKPVLLVGLTVFGAASGGCASAGSVGQLVGWRAAQGAGAALLLPGSLAVLAAAHPDGPVRRRAVGVWAATGGLALVAGPVVGGLLVASYGWRAVFVVNVPLVLLVITVVLATPGTPGRARRLDLPGALLTTTALGSATYAVVLAGRSGLDGSTGTAAAVAVGSALALLVVERRPDPLLPLALLRDRHFVGAAVGAFAASLAVFVVLVFVSLLLQLVQDKGALAAGLALLPLPAALVVTAPLGGRGRGTRTPVVTGLLLAASGLLALGLRLGASTGRVELGLLLAVVGAGVGLTTAPLVTAALTAAGPERSGLAAATVNVAREFGGVVAVAGLGTLAVVRLSHRLEEALRAGGVAARDRPALVDALLGARTDEVRRLVLQDLGLGPALKLGSTLTDTATASFVASTRLVLAGAGMVLLLAAAGAALLLAERPHGPRLPRMARGRPLLAQGDDAVVTEPNPAQVRMPEK